MHACARKCAVHKCVQGKEQACAHSSLRHLTCGSSCQVRSWKAGSAGPCLDALRLLPRLCLLPLLLPLLLPAWLWATVLKGTWWCCPSAGLKTLPAVDVVVCKNLQAGPYAHLPCWKNRHTGTSIVSLSPTLIILS